MPSIQDQIIANTNYSQMANAASNSSAQKSESSSTINSQAFLRLLTEQLKYQDPMNPMDNSEMLAQEAQFATLEQMEQLASSFSTFSNVYQANSLLGQCVRVEVDGQGYVGIVEGVDFSDSNGASVFVGEKYYPLSSITNVYQLSASPDTGEDGSTEGETGGTEGDTSTEESGNGLFDAATTALSAFGGSAAKNVYEYAKQTINDLKGQ